MIRPEFIADRPEDVGIDSERLEAVFARARREVEDDIVPGAQIAVARQGRVAGLRTFGSSVQDGVERPTSDQTLYCIFSCTKAVVASAVWLLFEEQLLRLDERVAEIIPEFATNGKSVVTVEQVLLHSGGFPYAPFAPRHWLDRQALLDAFAYWRLTFEPGTRYEYHATSGHWVLAEIIERRTGMNYRDFIRERITGPMRLDELFLGLPPEQDARFAEIRYVGDPVEPPAGYGEVTPESVVAFNDTQHRRAGAPGAGAISGAGELALFYQTLINGGEAPNGSRILKPETIAFGTQVRSGDLRDRLLDMPINRGLSVLVAGDDGYSHFRGLGRTVSPRAFGHNGAGGQIGWGDPETGISLAYCTNGFTDYITLGRRITALSSLAAVCSQSAVAT